MEMSQSHLKFIRENPIYIDGVKAKKKELGIDEESIIAMYAEMDKFSNESNFDDIEEEFDSLFGGIT